MYRKVAGLSQLEPGYKKFQVKPMFVKGIEEWGTEFESVYGKIVANTSCKNGKIHVHVEVPANTTAVIVLLEKEEVHEVGSGVYDYEYDTETSLAVERFSMDSILGEIVAEPLAVEMFNQMAPGMLEGPMIEFAYGMTLAELLGAAPQAKPMYEAVVNALNQKERESGYSVVSPSEGEIVAKKFYEMGYQTAVVTYTTNLLQMIPLKAQPMLDLMRAIRYIRKHAEELHVDQDKIMLCGFSAGAHACGSVAVHWQEFENTETGEYASISAKPNAVILSYPVITSGDCAHRGSFTALLGADASEEELEYMSLENQVTEDMPPYFLWQTATDDLVPVRTHSYLHRLYRKRRFRMLSMYFPKVFTRELWEMATECPVVFPAGIGVVPWMVAGGREIAVATSELMKKYDLAIWAHHGMFAAGEDFDLTFGLMHTAEKSAEILVKMLSMRPDKLQTITPDNFRHLAKDFNVTLPEEFLYEK